MADMASGSGVPHEQRRSPEQSADLTSKLAQGADEVADQAVEGAQRARHRLEDELAQRRSQLSERLRDVSDVLDSAGRKLGDDDLVADGLHYVSDKIERAASYIESSDAQSLTGDLRDAVRERPAWFLGGAFIAGIALARFARSSAEATALDAAEGGPVQGRRRPAQTSGTTHAATGKNATGDPSASRSSATSNAGETPGGAAPQPPNQRARQP